MLKKANSRTIDSAPVQSDRIDRLVVSIQQVVASAKRHLASRSKEDVGGLSGAQLWALRHIQASPGLTVLELAARLSVHQSTTSNLVDRLESAKLIRKQRSTQDKRIVRLNATAAGARLLGQATVSGNGQLPEALRRLSPEEMAALELAMSSLSRELGVPRKS